MWYQLDYCVPYYGLPITVLIVPLEVTRTVISTSWVKWFGLTASWDHQGLDLGS